MSNSDKTNSTKKIRYRKKPDKNKSSDSYSVGYKKPPKNTQFKKGQSGNPKGRPKERERVKGIQTLLFEKLASTMQMRTPEGVQNITYREGVVLRMLEKAIKQGDYRSIMLLLEIERKGLEVLNSGLNDNGARYMKAMFRAIFDENYDIEEDYEELPEVYLDT